MLFSLLPLRVVSLRPHIFSIETARPWYLATMRKQVGPQPMWSGCLQKGKLIGNAQNLLLLDLMPTGPHDHILHEREFLSGILRTILNDMALAGPDGA